MKQMEHRITSSGDPSISLYIRERKPALARPGTVPLLLVHGATIASVLWDNPLADWSWMDRLANDGFHVFAVDIRGYGGSSRPKCFAEPANAAPYARAADVLQDVTDAIAHIKNLTQSSNIDLFGGSWGSIICGQLVAENPAINIRRLVLYAPLYAETTTRPVWLPNLSLDTPLGAFRQVSLQDFRQRWDAEIPVEDKSLWRCNGVLEALVESCVKDETSGQTDSFRVPNGTILDLNEVFSGRPLYDATAISIPTLLLRGSADPTSTHNDASGLFERIGAQVKRYVLVGNGAHFMIAENKIAEVHAVVTGFLYEDL